MVPGIHPLWNRSPGEENLDLPSCSKGRIPFFDRQRVADFFIAAQKNCANVVSYFVC